MLFSTYKMLAYVGLVVCPIFEFALFDLFFQDAFAALGLTLFIALLVTPLQFYQLSRLQDALDDHDGSIPMGRFAWYELEDDDDSDTNPFDDRPKPQAGLPSCPRCGHVLLSSETPFCAYCGARVRPAPSTDGLPSGLPD